MSDYPELIRVILPAGADDDALEDCEDALLDDLDEVLGDVAGTEPFEDRPSILVAVRDVLSGAIGVRRILQGVPAPAGCELITRDVAGNESREAL